MTPHDDTQDEPQIAAALGAAIADAAPVDRDALAKLRAQSTDAFAAALASTPGTSWYARPGVRWLAMAAAVAGIGIGLYFWFSPSNVASAPTLGQALDNLDKADTVRARLVIGETIYEYWHTNQPVRSRWDSSEGTYRIADETGTWNVNEKANEAQHKKAPVKQALAIEQILRQVALNEGRQQIAKARPNEYSQGDDANVLVYRLNLTLDHGDPENALIKILIADRHVWLDARVDPKTHRLQSMRTWTVNGDKKTMLAELTILAYDEPIAAEKFAIADTLTEDGRIGKVTDVQGIVSIKPVLHERWTPVRDGIVLRPGDLVRTDARGANATALRLVKSTGVVLGPKTLVELIGPKQIRLIEGEVEVTSSAKAPVEVLGPEAQKIAVKGRQLYRVEKNQVAEVKKDPPWLLGFKGATTNETLGSLVALVDGRNVPLTVGYHKVTVDIRDQIARTVIEESFVNHTKHELEGVFYFPLPADASISGFGMWIGDKLVEADVVEKQRAREIYEQILRERRDPGLLEWSGGNIFKARVYPIPANGEKRIKISYTQVLPMKGNRYRYSYALQSELLRQHPLRDLSIDVKVNSAATLKSATSPTHPTRDERTPHSAHVEFTAQEYTPTRDFEVVVETDARQGDVVVIPHRRGDDGYFMLQLTPPGTAGAWDRPLLGNGDPVDLLILADTSASIDASQRATQATFLGALLSSLTAKDTFNLATCDIDCQWAFAKAKRADPDSVSAARDFLANRTSLGWTNLDTAFADALKRCGKGTHIIYVGDGIVTTRDADPVAFTKRLRRMYGDVGTLHAVTLGSSYESAVLKTIASLGGGSLRKITGEQGPTVVARELLAEIAQPALRDIKVEFKGIKAARVYPETLANIPVGSQQILLGRYLPEGRDQAGEVIVTGTQGGKPVRFSTRVTLKDAEHGNSFIPRLWARMHLDRLLEQGASESIRDEIISLSEEYQIITPYTSLLVLETDADRERFKVKRRFLMRDGERFFAAGHDNAMFDLAQKQMKRAGAWRTALRRSVLSELARLGRNPQAFRRAPYERGSPYSELASLQLERFKDDSMSYGWDGTMPLEEKRLGELEDVIVPGLLGLGDGDIKDIDDLKDRDKDIDEVLFRRGDRARKEEQMAEATDPAVAFTDLSGEMRGVKGVDGENEYGLYAADVTYSLGRTYRPRPPYYGQWLNTLFPSLGASPRKTKDPKSTWPAAARDLAKSLLRNDTLAKLTGGIEIVRQSDTFDARWNELSARSRRLELVSAKSWLTRSESDGGQTLVSWCDGKEVGVFSRAFQLGRLRAATPLDVQPPPLELGDHSMMSLERSYATYTPTLEPQGKDRTLLILRDPSSGNYETRILIDTARHVIVSMEDRYKGKVTGTTRFDDFVEVAGSWWARRIENTNADGKRTLLVTQTIQTLTADALTKQYQAELANQAQVQFLHQPLPTVTQAKKALAAGKAGFDDQVALMLHFYGSQQWSRVLDHLQAAEKLSGKPGMRWVRSAVLNDSRRQDEVRKRYREDAERIIKTPPADAYYLAEYIVGQSTSMVQANEMLTLLDAVKPIYDKQPVHVHAPMRWQRMRLNYLDQAGREDEAMRLRQQLATDYPRDYSFQQQYAQALARAGDYPAAYAWLTRVLVKEAKWLDWEDDYLRGTYTELLQQQGRYDDLVKYIADWVQRNPNTHPAYEQYLSALIRTDQIDKADALALKWLKDAEKPEELSPPAKARLAATVNLMLGNGHQLWTNRIEPRWLTPLADAAVYFIRHDDRASTATQILQHHQFRNSDEWLRVRKKLAGIVVAEIAKLPPEQVSRMVTWLARDDIEQAAWKKIADTLRQRWNKEAKDDNKHALGQAIVSVLGKQDDPTDLLAFLRVQMQTGPARWRADYARNLFDTLLAQAWSAEFEGEALGLLDKLSSAEEPGPRLQTSVAALYRLTDRMLENRIAVGNKAIEHAEKLTRTELLKKQDDIRRAARAGLADRLAKEAGKHPGALGQWLRAESVYLDMLLERNLKETAAAAWTVLGAAPPKAIDPDDDNAAERTLDSILRHRYVVVLANLAARKGADPASADRLVKYIDQGIASDANRWKLVKYRLLIALDRTKDLEQTLKQWTREDDSDNRWRLALGRLYAEQGKLADAIRAFEAVEAADELTPNDYRSLSEWYLVQNQREAHERAGMAVYKTMPEYRLNQMISAKLGPWSRRDGHLPTQLDPEVLRMFAVLFDKSSAPQNYLYHLQRFYEASHDFRLLSGLPDAVIGHTAERVYPFVAGMQGVLGEVRDEATADEIVKRIGEVRPRAKTDVDRRALDLLELLVERRASEVVNQPKPHLDKALTAFERAAKRNWGPGEPRLMADFLASLGKITQPALADKQLNLLGALHKAETARGTPDSLHIALRHAVTLNNYGRRAEAIDLLEVELKEFQAAHGDVLPVEANSAFATYVGYLDDAGHFARGEKVLLGQVARPANARQKRWLIVQLDRLYHHALARDGEVALGKGAMLYQALNAKIQKGLADRDPQQRYELMTLLCAVYRTANDKKMESVVTDLRTFAFEIAPPMLRQPINSRDSAVSSIAQTVRDLAGPRDGIVFLLDEIDNEPRWLRFNNQDGWSRHGGTIAEWRVKAKDLGDVEGRLLKLVLKELRRDLETRESRRRAMYSVDNGNERFWNGKSDEFAKVAEAVLAEHRTSGATAQYVAAYFHDGIHRPGRAIEILFASHKDKLLDEAGQVTLIRYLHDADRYAESIPLLQPLVERRPQEMDYRVQLMRAYFKTKRVADLRALLKASDAYFHEKDRWGESPLSALAHSTLKNELFPESVAYYKELIPLHERTQPNRGIRNGTLAKYYTELASAYAALKKTPEAVDAASAAVVAWGPRSGNRERALDTLREVLAKSEDLDGYVAQLDKQAQDSAIIRKAAGEAYRERKDFAKAIKQLELAVQLQPNDADTYQLLVRCYDDIGDKQGAIKQLLQAVQHTRRDGKLYQDLGKRYTATGQVADAERAYTSIVEMLPSEAESHAQLAEIRENQGRWAEAIAEWQEVARLRALEPTGLLKLAAAQIHEKQWEPARESIRKLESRSWPQRFEDVRKQVRELKEKLPTK